MKRSTLGIILIVIGIACLIYFSSSEGKNAFSGLLSFAIKEVNEEQVIDVEAINNIHIDTGSNNVHIQRGTGSQAIIKLHGKTTQNILKELNLDVQHKDGTLEISNKDSDGFRFGFNWNNVVLTVVLPEKIWNKVSVDLGSGNIYVTDLNAEQIVLEANSGNVQAQMLTMNDLTVEVKSGNIKLEQLEAQNISLQASSGNITMEKYKAELLNFNVNSGNVKFIDGQAEMKGKASSGNIKIETDMLRYDADLKTNSGNIDVILTQDPESLAIDYRGGSGNGRIKKDGFVYDVDSDDRDVVIGAFGDGELSLIVRTGSGNFTLK